MSHFGTFILSVLILTGCESLPADGQEEESYDYVDSGDYGEAMDALDQPRVWQHDDGRDTQAKLHMDCSDFGLSSTEECIDQGMLCVWNPDHPGCGRCVRPPKFDDEFPEPCWYDEYGNCWDFDEFDPWTPTSHYHGL